MVAIRSVDLRDFAPAASEILRAAWRPPCLDYSEEYLRWQFSFPTALPPVGLAGYSGEHAVGFVAATGRQSNAGPIYVSSFLSILPGAPSSMAIGIVRQQSRILCDSGVPTLVFAQAGSTGEQLLAIGDTVGLKRRSLGEYRVHGAIPGFRPSRVEIQSVQAADWAPHSDTLRPSTSGFLSLEFDQPTLEHLTKDPFRREFLLARLGGAVVGSAMLSEMRMIAPTGPQSLATLHCVRLLDDDADVLSSLLQYAGSRGPVVNVGNVTGLSAATRRAAGLRASPSVFVAYLSAAREISDFDRTDFEIV